MEHFTLGSRYYYSRLSQFEREKYRETYDQLVDGCTSAQFCLPGTDFVFPSGLTVPTFVNYILADNPHLFHLDLSCIHYRRIGPTIELWTDVLYSSDEFSALYADLHIAVKGLLREAEKLDSDFRKVRFFHDYLSKTNHYSLLGPDERSKLEAHTIVGGLLGHQCVCDGYARSFRLLCDQAHISCIVALGESMQSGSPVCHAWNFVKLEKLVYHCDVTWDSVLYHKDFPFWDYYFLRSDNCFIREHHWDPHTYPPTAPDHPLSLKPVSDKWELEKYVLEKLKEQSPVFVVPLADSFPGNKASVRIFHDLIRRNPQAFGKQRIHHTEYFDDRKMLVVYMEG